MDEIIKYEDYQNWLDNATPKQTLRSTDNRGSNLIGSAHGAIPIEYRRKYIHKSGGFVETYCESKWMKG